MELEQLVVARGYNTYKDLVNGPTSSQAHLRLFGRTEQDVRVTLYRDKHAQCPDCQRVWLWLEEMEIPYRVEKTTMNRNGDKAPQATPTVQIDGQTVTESEGILEKLEKTFGPLNGQHKIDQDVVHVANLERELFKAWCDWLL